MSDQTIPCPNCSYAIPVTEALSGKIKKELEGHYADKLKQKDEQLALERAKIQEEKTAIEKRELDFDKVVNQKIEIERIKILEDTKKKVAEENKEEIEELRLHSIEQKNKIQELQSAELDLRKQRNALEQEKQSLELDVQRRVDVERDKIFQEAKQQALGETDLKLKEKDKMIDMMRKQIDEAKRKGEQGSMQVQGEVQEDELKAALSQAFPVDLIDDVPQGTRGADLVQTVHSQYGNKLGVILWESKNTKNWSSDWIKKLKSDQGLVKADLCILVSQVLPNDVTTFTAVDGVWVCHYRYALALAHVLRSQVLEIGKLKDAMVGKDEKMEMLYAYLSGPQFRNRVENIVMAFGSLQEELTKERRSMERMWAKRGKEIEKVMINTTGMYGDLQGIIGDKVLPSVETLELAEGED